MVSTQQVAAYWWCDESRIRTWIANGTIPLPSVVGGVARWQQLTLDEWEAAGYPRSQEPTWKNMSRILRALYRESLEVYRAKEIRK